MSAPLSPIPNDAAVTEQDRTVTRRWYLWLFEVWIRVRACPVLVGAPFSRSNQSASIVNATIATIVQAGIYRISHYIRVTTIPTTSFSLTVTYGWRDGGVSKTRAFTALTGAPGALATAYDGGSLPVKADSGTLVTISVAYVSVGATAAVFAVDAPVEMVN